MSNTGFIILNRLKKSMHSLQKTQITAIITILLLSINGPILSGNIANAIPSDTNTQATYEGQTDFAAKHPEGAPSPEHLIYYRSDNTNLATIKQDMAAGKNNLATPGTQATTTGTAITSPSGFDGLAYSESGLYYPPDVQVAVGPSHIVQMVNLAGRIFDKSGNTVSNISLVSFFNTGSDFISDPKIMYDAPSGRWFASIADISTSSVKLAVSSTSDPRSTWYLFNFNFGNNYCPDQPILGLNDDKVVISVNEFSNKCGINGGSVVYVGAQYVVINKQNLLTPPAPPGPSTYFSTPVSSLFSLHPAQAFGTSGKSLYMASVGSGSTSNLVVLKITGNPINGNTTQTRTNIAISAVGIPPNGVQPNTGSAIDTGDARVQDAKWYNNKLWIAFNDSCLPSGDTKKRSCLHLVQLTTSTSPISKSQDFFYGVKNSYLFYPVLEIDTSSNLSLAYGVSSSITYPSIYSTGQLSSASANTLQAPLLLKAGASPDTSGRYGDYFGAGLDPSVAGKVWVSGEYHKASSSKPWSTWIASITQ